MRKVNEQKLYRVMDANFNRAKEGLRVCEDVCRFVLDRKGLTRGFKDIRHELTAGVLPLGFLKLVECRNIEGDVGRGSTAAELGRKEVSDILFANIQRVKESMRVLEEFSKMRNVKTAQEFKKLRYRVYALERKIVAGR